MMSFAEFSEEDDDQPLNKPMRGDVKKFKVYVKDPDTGNVKKVNFADVALRQKCERHVGKMRAV